MSVHHSFNIEHAQLYGLREAVLIHNLHHWVSYHYANGTNHHDGRTWTYNSVKAFEDLFPYLTYKQIRTSLETLIVLDVLVRGNYNKNPADRTSWFAFTDTFLENNPLPTRANGSPKKEKPLPTRANGLPTRANGDALQGKSLEEPNVNTDVNAKKKTQAPSPLVLPDWINQKHWDAWHSCDKRKKATDAQKQMAIDKLAKWRDAGIDHATALENAAIGGWQGLFEPDNKKPSRPAPATQIETFAERDARLKREEWERSTGKKWPEQDLPASARSQSVPAPYTLEAETRRIS